MVLQHSTAGWPLSCFSPWAVGWVSAGRGQPSLSKLSYPFCLCYLKSFQLGLKRGRQSLLLQDVLSLGSGAWPVQLHMAFIPQLPKSHPPTLLPILHTAWVMRVKQITVVTYFQPPSSRKLPHQKLSMSPVQPQKSKQSRNVRCQIAGRLL